MSIASVSVSTKENYKILRLCEVYEMIGYNALCVQALHR
jgi:hypothetical protein